MSQKDLQTSLQAAWADDVLNFWFEELRAADWFKSDPDLDAKIRARFGDLYTALKARPPAPRELDASALLAAVLVFDQFPRNMFRRTPDAYASDASALELANHAVATGMDRTLSKQQRQFLYLPFMHSEDRGMQAESVRLCSELGIPDNVKYARHHHAVIERFGRFPHRNAILGRTSTPDELEFLKTEAPLV
jgi:uncharacterized protein (DUF924 family)